MLDFVSDQSDLRDVGGIAFDTDNDGGNFPDLDDYFIFGPNSVYHGDGQGGWIHIDEPYGLLYVKGFSSIHDPYESGRDHLIYEFQIPCSFLGANNHYGFYAQVWEFTGNTFLEWPVGAGGDRPDEIYNWEEAAPAPENWGDITSEVDFVPEFPLLFIPPLFLTATFFAIVLKKRLTSKC